MSVLRKVGFFAIVAVTTLALIPVAFAGGATEEAGAAKSLSSQAGFTEKGLPIVKEKVSLSFMGMNMNPTRVGRMDETEMMKWLEEKTNVKIVWDLIPQNEWKEKKNLIIASQQLPDGFMAPLTLTSDEAAKFGGDGVLIPLDDLLQKYAPTITGIMKDYPTYDPFVRSLDGNIYALAWMQDMGFDSFSGAIINKEWLDKLGLKVPTTTEEFYQVLKAFKESDPAGDGKTIPFSFLYQESQAINREVKREFEWVFLAFGVPENPRHIAIDDSGQVIFTADKPGFRDAIKYLNRLYSEGLIDKEMFTQDRTLLTNKIRAFRVGAYTDYRLKTSMATEEIQDKFTFIPPLKGPTGDRKWLRAAIGMSEGAFALTNVCKYPEVAIRWLDYINEPEINIQMAYGMFKPEGWNQSEAMVPSKAQPGKYDVNTNLRPKSVQASDWPFSSPIAESPILTARWVIEKYCATKPSNLAKLETCDVYRPYLTKYPYNYPFRFTVSEIEDLSLMQTDLISYILKTEADWIANGRIDEQWDAYLAQLKNLEVDKYLEMYKTAYARSLKK
jgi:putative aldouronate transport system substrate-binding protein